MNRFWGLARRSRLLRWALNLPQGGLMVGLTFFALSLTPSLLPRSFVLQGILSGCVFAAGYGIGVFLQWLWDYLGLRLPRKAQARRVGLVLVLASLALAIAFLWFSTGWQNSIRTLMGMPDVESSQPMRVAAIATIPALLLISLGTAIVRGVQLVSRWLARLIPPRVAFIGSLLIVGVLTSMVVNGVILRWALATADQFYAEFDTRVGRDDPPPTDPLHSGSAASLIAWDTIGTDARVYVETGPTAEDITALTGKPAVTPLRVYVGLRSAATAEARAQLALAEMLRIGAFDRAALVLIMPVGTGWVDPPAIDTLEILHGGDVASVALQYSYLTSWLSLVVEPEVGTAAAEALFHAVYNYWTDLPHDTRPKLYLHGLSLGAYASQTSASLYAILADPFDGALWAGPPFASANWRNITANRQPDTPQWLPRFEDGTIIRFTNHNGDLTSQGDHWGPVRLVYLQNSSDPIVFFDPTTLYRPPEWLSGVRAPDVSPLLHWYPVVTFLQLALDMALAQTSPIGFGHVYAPQDYFDGWVAVTNPPGWTPEDLASLKARLTRHGDKSLIEQFWYRAPITPRS